MSSVKWRIVENTLRNGEKKYVVYFKKPWSLLWEFEYEFSTLKEAMEYVDDQRSTDVMSSSIIYEFKDK